MKLVAVKRISRRRPVGDVFEESRSGARLLIAAGFARPYVSVDPVTVSSDEMWAPIDGPGAPTPRPRRGAGRRREA